MEDWKRETSRIGRQLRRSYDGDAWYGPPLRGLLEDLTAAEAAARPLPAAHSIWEIVLHTAAWLGAVSRRLASGPVELPAEGDWPAVGSTDEASWRRARDLLAARQEELVHAVEVMADERLDERFGAVRDVHAGAGVSVYTTLHGVVQHGAYHAGQVALLKRALRG